MAGNCIFAIFGYNVSATAGHGVSARAGHGVSTRAGYTIPLKLTGSEQELGLTMM